MFNTSQIQRRHWKKKGVLEDLSNNLWCAAGYTYSTELAEKVSKEKSKKSFKEIVLKVFHKYAKVFSEVESERLPEHKPYNHAIELKPETLEMICSKVYPMPVNEQEELDRFLSDSLQKRYITPSKLPIASPVFFIKKKDGHLCLVQDYQKLNEFTVKNCYPLSLASDIINCLHQVHLFTKFNICWRYNNIHIKAGNEWKATFTTNHGLFEPQVMLLRLTNFLTTFQALMNTIFTDLMAAGKIAIYLDNISMEEHHHVTHEVLECLAAHNLYLRPEKCEFDETQVKYLDLIIKKGKVAMNPIKVQAITAWPVPCSLWDLHVFLGFVNFYHCFIKNFTKLTHPLNDPMKKDVPWCWHHP